ncbi:MAG: hypothetical protein ABSD71_06225 [Bacteroidales bacterium]
MKALRTICLLAAFMLPGMVTFSQCKQVSGDISVLKGQSVINLQFDYSKMGVGKYKDEADYISDKTASMNKKKPGDGDRWAEAWKNDRTARFQPMLEKSLNDRLSKFNVSCKEDATDAKYTIIIRTVFTEPGYNAGITRENAWIKLEVDIVETSNPSNVLASLEMRREDSISMMGYDFDTGGRIQSAYDRAGGHLGAFLDKEVFK